MPYGDSTSRRGWKAFSREKLIESDKRMKRRAPATAKYKRLSLFVSFGTLILGKKSYCPPVVGDGSTTICRLARAMWNIIMGDPHIETEVYLLTARCEALDGLFGQNDLNLSVALKGNKRSNVKSGESREEIVWRLENPKFG